jgi:hypothetical protein
MDTQQYDKHPKYLNPLLSPEKTVPYPLAKHYGEYPPKNLTPKRSKQKTMLLTS